MGQAESTLCTPVGLFVSCPATLSLSPVSLGSSALGNHLAVIPHLSICFWGTGPETPSNVIVVVVAVIANIY